MCIVFNVAGLCALSPGNLPMVAQSFVCHDAVLYKIFVIGEAIFVEKRPSLKNFVASAGEIFYFYFVCEK